MSIILNFFFCLSVLGRDPLPLIILHVFLFMHGVVWEELISFVFSLYLVL